MPEAGGAGRGVARGGQRARRGARRRGRRDDDPRPGDRTRDRRPRPRDRRRPDRARLLAALAAAVALLLADGRLRAPAGAVRGADRRVPAARARRGARRDLSPSGGCEPALSYAGSREGAVVGCGRVGSAVALELRAAGWDVTVIDEREDALGRLGDDWTGEFHVGHGMDIQLLRERRHRGRRRRRRHHRRRQLEHRHRPDGAEALRRALGRRPRARPGPGRVLQVARAERRLPDLERDRDAHRTPFAPPKAR